MAALSTSVSQVENSKESFLLRLLSQYGAAIWVRLLSLCSIVVVFPRILNKQELGQIIFALTFIEVAATFGDFGFGQLATVQIANNDQGWRQSMGQGVRVRLAGAFAVLIGAAALGFGLGSGEWQAAMIMSLGLIPMAWTQNARSYWNGHHRVIWLMLSMCVSYTLCYLGAIAAGIQWGVQAVLVALLCSFWLEILVTMLWCRAEDAGGCYRLFHLGDAKDIYNGIKTALPFGLYAIAWFMYLRIDILLFPFFSEEGLAEYGIAMKLYSFSLMLIQGGALVVLSDSRKMDVVIRKIGRLGYPILLSLVLTMGAFVYGAPVLVRAVLPLSYASISSLTIQVLVVAGYLHAVTLILGTVALGNRAKMGRALWPVFLVGSGILLLLAAGESVFSSQIWWAYNRLGIDVVILLAVAVMYLREAKAGCQSEPKSD